LDGITENSVGAIRGGRYVFGRVPIFVVAGESPVVIFRMSGNIRGVVDTYVTVLVGR